MKIPHRRARIPTTGLGSYDTPWYQYILIFVIVQVQEITAIAIGGRQVQHLVNIYSQCHLEQVQTIVTCIESYCTSAVKYRGRLMRFAYLGYANGPS